MVLPVSTEQKTGPPLRRAGLLNVEAQSADVVALTRQHLPSSKPSHPPTCEVSCGVWRAGVE